MPDTPANRMMRRIQYMAASFAAVLCLGIPLAVILAVLEFEGTVFVLFPFFIPAVMASVSFSLVRCPKCDALLRQLFDLHQLQIPTQCPNCGRPTNLPYGAESDLSQEDK